MSTKPRHNMPRFIVMSGIDMQTMTVVAVFHDEYTEEVARIFVRTYQQQHPTRAVWLYTRHGHLL